MGTERSLRKSCGILCNGTSCRREHDGRRPHEPQTREEQRQGRDSRRRESKGGLSRTDFATSPLPELKNLGDHEEGSGVVRRRVWVGVESVSSVY